MATTNKISVKRGSVTVWVYHTPTGQHDGWTVAHYEPTGERKRTFRAKLADAKAFAEKTATRLSNVESSAANLTDQEASDAAEARLLLPGRTLASVAREFKDSVARLGTVPLQIAVDCYLEHHQNGPVSAPAFATVVAELIAAKRQDGRSERHLGSLEDRLTKFAGEFEGTVSALSSPVMDDLLRAMQKKFKWSGRTRNHYRAALSSVLHYAKRRQYLPRSWNEMEFVPKAQEEDGEIGVYTADDLTKILAKCDDKDLLPFVVLGAFAGPRPSEICRLEWADLHFDSGEIFIARGKVRTAGHRVAPLLPACAAWLSKIKKQKGPLTRLVDFSHPLQEVLRSAGVAAVHDGLRHSFISYRQAVLKDLGQVSSETGTNEKTLTRRYCRPVKAADAEAWFQVLPT